MTMNERPVVAIRRHGDSTEHIHESRLDLYSCSRVVGSIQLIEEEEEAEVANDHGSIDVEQREVRVELRLLRLVKVAVGG